MPAYTHSDGLVGICVEEYILKYDKFIIIIIWLFKTKIVSLSHIL
jgi:hypothetical protein